MVVQEEEEPEVAWPSPDVTVLRLKGEGEDPDSPDELVQPDRSDIEVTGPLGAQLLLWEVATAVAGRLLGINPFDQPDVESAKKAARGLLESKGGQAEAPAFTDGAVEVRALGGDWLGSASTLDAAVDALFAQLGSDGYVAVMAYLDRLADASLAERPPAHRRAHRPTDDVRLGTALPALDRPVPQGWPGHGCLPAGHDGPARRPGCPRPRLHLRRVHRGPGRR